MKGEIWKDIEGFEGYYMVSNLGNVKSLNYRHTGKEKILKPSDNGHGYLKVGLFKDGKRKDCRINRLVAIAFIPNPYNLPEVNHIDHCRINNNVENLEWCTSQYNVEYSQAKAIIGIDKITGLIVEFSSIMEASRQTGTNQSHITKCCKGKLKSCGGFYWHYANVTDNDDAE